MLCQYTLQDKFPGSDALLIGRFYRSGSEWVFEALENAYNNGLNGLIEYYQ
jgi:stress response protein SCP2